jgi:hypothetical protein
VFINSSKSTYVGIVRKIVKAHLETLVRKVFDDKENFRRNRKRNFIRNFTFLLSNLESIYLNLTVLLRKSLKNSMGKKSFLLNTIVKKIIF